MKKKIISAVMLATIAASTVSAPLVAKADEYDDKIQSQNDKIKNLKNQQAQLAAELADLNTKITDTKNQAAEIQGRQQELSAKIVNLKSDIKDLEERIAKRQETLENQARSVQIKGTSSTYLEAVLTAESFSDAIGRVTNINRMVNANKDLMEQQESDKQEVESKEKEATKKLDKVNAYALELEQKLGDLDSLQIEKEITQNDLAAQQTTEESKKAEYIKKKEAAEKKKAEEERLAKEAEERRQAEAVSAASNSNDSAASTTSNAATTSNNSSSSNDDSSSASASSATTQSVPSTSANLGSPASGSGIVADAYKQVGKPYVWGATGPSSFDCSGLVQYVFAANGISLPRVTTAQEYAGTMISLSELQAGDLVFFGSRGSTHHVGIYIGGGQYIHAPQPGQNVTVQSISAYTPNFGVRIN